MKYKHLAMLMGVMITATSVGSTATAFAEESKTESTQDADDTTEDTAEASDADGKTRSSVGTDGTTYVEGDSDYTITVGSYQDSADTFVSTTVDDWSSYEVERPESL